MDIQYNISLKPFNTLGLDVRAAAFYQWTDIAVLPALLNEAARYSKVLWLGGGSNVVLTGDFDGLVIQIATRGIRHTICDEHSVLVTATAGEIWHGFVERTIKNGWYGLENLSLIPGTVGAAPIQNIGAYGVEVSERIKRVFGINTATRKPFILSQEQCLFSYRNSIFKQDAERRLLITAVEFQLSTYFNARTEYKEVAERTAALAQGKVLTARHVADAVCAIRREKLPDPHKLGNVGSFFHNPIVPARFADKLLQQHPHMPYHPQPDGRVKLSAAWLIEQAGLKGMTSGGMGVYEKHALVLVNHGNATPQDVLTLSQHIQTTVHQRFGIQLQPEPRFVE